MVTKTKIFNCNQCGKNALGRADQVESGRRKYCSISCANRARMLLSKRDQSGNNNPNWKGGISKDNYHYKKLQKKRYPERVEARQKVSNALRSGRIKRQPCENCGRKAQAHHNEYSRPLEIRWLCVQCHKNEHNGMSVGYI